jgi:hypothetical protein
MSITSGVNSMNKKAKEIDAASLYTAFKMVKAEHMRDLDSEESEALNNYCKSKYRKVKRWWHPTVWSEKAVHGADTVKKYFIGIKVKF